MHDSREKKAGMREYEPPSGPCKTTFVGEPVRGPPTKFVVYL